MWKSYEEVNLVDWPLVVFDNMADFDREKERFYNVSIWNKLTKHKMEGYLKIYFISDDESSTLEEHDEDVLLVLMHLANEKMYLEKTMEFSSANEVLKALGWSRGGKNYTKLKSSLRRLAGILLETNVWYNKAISMYEKKIFHLIESVEYDRRDGSKNLNSVVITWSNTIWMSMNAGYVKPIALSDYFSIKQPGARKLYRVIDKRMYKKRILEIPVSYLSVNIMGMHPSKSIEQMRAQLDKYLQEIAMKRLIGFYAFHRNNDDRKLTLKILKHSQG